eukprot:GHVN01072984.1.p1 GENE.GHVN01072984.1~~GHVN01072984.1.p1  ORF type:complete len:703 (+),score=92.69 GHVN01072984.1:2637-4745(+)
MTLLPYLADRPHSVAAVLNGRMANRVDMQKELLFFAVKWAALASSNSPASDEANDESVHQDEARHRAIEIVAKTAERAFPWLGHAITSVKANNDHHLMNAIMEHTKDKPSTSTWTRLAMDLIEMAQRDPNFETQNALCSSARQNYSKIDTCEDDSEMQELDHQIIARCVAGPRFCESYMVPREGCYDPRAALGNYFTAHQVIECLRNKWGLISSKKKHGSRKSVIVYSEESKWINVILTTMEEHYTSSSSFLLEARAHHPTQAGLATQKNGHHRQHGPRRPHRSHDSTNPRMKERRPCSSLSTHSLSPWAKAHTRDLDCVALFTATSLHYTSAEQRPCGTKALERTIHSILAKRRCGSVFQHLPPSMSAEAQKSRAVPYPVADGGLNSTILRLFEDWSTNCSCIHFKPIEANNGFPAAASSYAPHRCTSVGVNTTNHQNGSPHQHSRHRHYHGPHHHNSLHVGHGAPPTGQVFPRGRAVLPGHSPDSMSRLSAVVGHAPQSPSRTGQRMTIEAIHPRPPVIGGVNDSGRSGLHGNHLLQHHSHHSSHSPRSPHLPHHDWRLHLSLRGVAQPRLTASRFSSPLHNHWHSDHHRVLTWRPASAANTHSPGQVDQAQPATHFPVQRPQHCLQVQPLVLRTGAQSSQPDWLTSSGPGNQPTTNSHINNSSPTLSHYGNRGVQPYNGTSSRTHPFGRQHPSTVERQV